MASLGSRDVMLTKYIKVNDKKAIQIEIQMTLRESSQKNSNRGIERKHLKEIIDLLKDVITHHVENENGKSKKTSTDLKILTGKMIRLGYMFKKKSENQTLLLSDDSDEEELYVHSLKIYNEKLVVYYHLLDEDSHLGSTTAMSQMVRALNDGKLSQSYSGTVSISCYFQKKDSASTSTTNIQGDSSGKTKTTTPSEEKSEENQKAEDHITNVEQKEKNAIKKIVQRSAPALGRRTKQRKIHHIESKGTDINSLENSNEGIDQKCCSSLGEFKTDDCDRNGTPESNWLSSDVDSLSCQDEGSPSKILVDSAYRHFTHRETDFSAKSSSGESLKCDTMTKTKSSFELCNTDSCGVAFSDNSSCAVDTVFFKQNTSTISKCENTSVESEYEKICKLSTCTQASHNVQRFDSDSDLPDFSFLKRTRASLLDKEEKLNTGLTTRNQGNMASEIIERGATSPIFDQKTRPLKRPLNSLDVSDDDSMSKDDVPEKRLKLKRQRVKRTLPEFPADNSEEKERPEAATEDFLSVDIPVNEWDGLPILASSRSSKKEKSEHQSKNGDSHQKKEGKETDHSLPVMESLTTSIKQEKRVFSFKKSAEKSKRQSILSFLTLSEQEECYEDRPSESAHCRDSDSLDCVIIDGLDDLQEPEFRDEETSSIESMISCLQRVDELSEQHLHYLVKKHKAYLQDIFSGKVFSERHDVYKKGGKSRKDLNHHVHLGLFTEEQLDVVMETLMSIFCKKHHKYLEYIMKVLLPEVLIKIYMTFHKMSHQEAEDDMLEAVKKPGGIHI